MKNQELKENEIVNDYLNGFPVYKMKVKYKTSHEKIKEICEKHKVWSLEINLNNKKKSKDSIRIVDYNIFENLNNQNCLYWLGFIAADGNVSDKLNTIGIGLQNKDKSHLEKFVNYINRPLIIHDVLHHKKYLQSVVRFNNLECKNALINLGITPNKTKTLVIDEKILNWHFIRGLIDGDGCIRFFKYKNKNLCLISVLTASLKFAEQIKSFFIKENINCNIRNDKRGHYEIRICNFKRCKLIIKSMYLNADTFLERKYHNAQLISNYLLKTESKLREPA